MLRQHLLMQLLLQPCSSCCSLSFSNFCSLRFDLPKLKLSLCCDRCLRSSGCDSPDLCCRGCSSCSAAEVPDAAHPFYGSIFSCCLLLSRYTLPCLISFTFPLPLFCQLRVSGANSETTACRSCCRPWTCPQTVSISLLLGLGPVASL